jgi:hypothetical protein
MEPNNNKVDQTQGMGPHIFVCKIVEAFPAAWICIDWLLDLNVFLEDCFVFAPILFLQLQLFKKALV